MIVNRERPAVLSTPAYMLAVLLTVLAGFFLFRFRSRRRAGAQPSASEDFSQDRLIGRITNNAAIAFFDALGLASFTVIGVIVAVETRCQPLWLWGRCLAP
jgi:polar amino acid transport system substrate-binding protein